MNQSSHPIGEQDVNLPGLDQRCDFARSPDGMTHRLSGPIRTFHIVRFAVF